jgi:hypothetical protein
MNIIRFLTALAWIFGIVSSIYIVIIFIGQWIYSNDLLQQLKDMRKGISRKWPSILKPTIISIICWAWIFSHC